MKKAVVTVCAGDRYKQISLLTHPSISGYADRIGAEFIVLDGSDIDAHWQKLKIGKLLLCYDRILYLDTDLLVREDCPDLISMVPDDKVGMFNEGRFSPREASLREACYKYSIDIPKWDGSYYNTGVMVLSRKHIDLFSMPTRIEDLGMWEQGYLNATILSRKIPVDDLDHTFNRMSLMDKYIGIDRLDSYIVHYAGAPSQFDLCGMISMDISRWQEKGPSYKWPRNVVIRMGGGLGDQVSSEPTARYIVDRLYAHDERKTYFYVLSDWPELFSHLKAPVLKSLDGPTIDGPARVLETIPAPDSGEPIWRVVTHIKCHTTDFSALSSMGQLLPDDAKQIKLSVGLKGVAEYLDVCGTPVEDMILVHPGRGWPSKTFPPSWWMGVINGLVRAGAEVGIIGKHIGGDQGYVDMPEIPDGVVDFRDALSTDGLTALLAAASVVVSNDSAPVHIAGAFDNYIVLIPSCKRPDDVLPYRKTGKYYKAAALFRRLTCDEWDSSPTRLYHQTADQVKGDILDYLPGENDVVRQALEFRDMARNGRRDPQISKDRILESIECA
jgi:hypothetical protein